MRTLPFVVVLTLAAAPLAAQHGPAAVPASAARDTMLAHFGPMFGTWEIEASYPTSPTERLTGRGIATIRWMLDGTMFAEDIRITMSDGSVIHGTTIRRYDAESDAWALAYIPAGAGKASAGTAIRRDGMVVETWESQGPAGTSHSELWNTFDAEGRWTTRMDTRRADGRTIERAWEMKALRRIELP